MRDLQYRCGRVRYPLEADRFAQVRTVWGKDAWADARYCYACGAVVRDSGHSRERQLARDFRSCLVVCDFDISKDWDLEVDLLPFLKSPGPVRCVDLLTDRACEFPRPKIKLKLPPCGAYVLQF